MYAQRIENEREGKLPEVTVWYIGKVVAPDTLENLVAELQEAVATTLHIEALPEGHLQPDEVEVHVFQAGPFDVQAVDIAIRVDANEYPARRAMLENAGKEIKRRVDKLLEGEGPKGRNLTSSVWPRVCLGKYFV